MLCSYTEGVLLWQRAGRRVSASVVVVVEVLHGAGHGLCVAPSDAGFETHLFGDFKQDGVDHSRLARPKFVDVPAPDVVVAVAVGFWVGGRRQGGEPLGGQIVAETVGVDASNQLLETGVVWKQHQITGINETV